MRLAYFTNTYPRATDTFIRREVIGLRQRGFDVETYSVRKTGSDHDVDQEVIQEKKNTHYLLPCSPLKILATHIKSLISQPLDYLRTVVLALKTARPGIKGHFLQAMYFAEAILLANLLKEHRIEHIHNHLGDNSGTVTLLAARFLEIPFSISIHGPHIFFDALHWALDTKTRYAKFISCIGHFCTSQMMLYTNQQDWHKFKIIRCGINPEQFNFSEPHDKAKKLVYVGRLSGEKGVPILLESLKQLQKRNYDFHLTLLGDGEDRKKLEQEVKQASLDQQITFGGFVDQETIATTLKDSDIFVLPSFAEGIPVALMEAMAIGTPVIATYVGGISELVIDGITGKVVYPSDPSSLADAIAFYMDNPEACKTIAKAAREKVVSEFEINAQVDKLAQLFSE